MRLNEIALSDKKIFQHYLNLSGHALAAYAFTDIYIWKRLFRIRWAIIEDNLCVFFQDKIGCFLYLPPLARKISARAVAGAFDYMEQLNRNPEVSRIENVEEKSAPYFTKRGFKVVEKSHDYLCGRADLAQLKGDAFKSKRASVNYFCKHYDFDYAPYRGKDKEGCLKLYQHWSAERKKSQDKYYQWLIADSFNALEVLLDNFGRLDCAGRVVKIGNEVKGFTFGYKIDQQTFCILYEVTDLSVKGLAQYIFREFCRELNKYRYINIMDDSGLANLAKVKLSYRPLKLAPAYIVQRQNA